MNEAVLAWLCACEGAWRCHCPVSVSFGLADFDEEISVHRAEEVWPTVVGDVGGWFTAKLVRHLPANRRSAGRVAFVPFVLLPCRAQHPCTLGRAQPIMMLGAG